MTKTIPIVLISFVLFLWGCSNKDQPTETDNIDTLVSDHFLDDSDYDPTEEDPVVVEEDTYDPPPKKNTISPKRSRSNSGRNGVDSDVDVIKYQNYERIGSNPDDFATAMIYPAIRMVYSDNFTNPRARVLSYKLHSGTKIINMAITWKDRWVSKYEIKGKLTVGEDGSNPAFIITEKNIEAEALEITEDDFRTEIKLDNI